MDGFCVLDTNGKILKANHAASKKLGYPEGEMLGMNISDLEAMETRAEIAKHMERIMKAGSDCFETKFYRKDGAIVDSEVSVNFVEIGEDRFFFFIFRDITKRKQVQQALRERDAELEIKASNLEEVNSALKVLLRKRDEDKTEFEEKVLFNVRQLVMPYIEKQICPVKNVLP